MTAVAAPGRKRKQMRRSAPLARASAATVASPEAGRTTVARQAEHIDTIAAAQALGRALRDPARPQPVCVIPIPLGAVASFVDVQDIVEQVGDVCRVVTIPTGDVTRALQDTLPDGLQVYGSTGRVYPVGLEWLARREDAPLRFVDKVNALRATAQLVEDAMTMAHRAGLYDRPRGTHRPAAGIVQSLLADDSRAFVRLDTGDFATIIQEQTLPGVSLARVVAPGQRVSGRYDAATRHFHIAIPDIEVAAVNAEYPDGCVTLALVTRLSGDSAQLALHPSLEVRISRSDVSSNPLDRLELLLEPGDVVPARVSRHRDGTLRLRLIDVDDDEPVVPALSLLPGSPPWLIEPQPVMSVETVEAAATVAAVEALEDASVLSAGDPAPASAPAGLVEVQVAGTGGARSALQSALLSLEESKATIRRLELELKATRAANPAELAEVKAELGSATREIADLRESLGKARRDTSDQRQLLREARRDAARSIRDRRERFATDDEWIRHEIHLAWIDRYSAGERSVWTLPAAYMLGRGFAQSLARLDEGQLTKAMKAAVDVLTGRVKEVPGRALHPLREGDGATAKDLVREDGARCYRCALEQDTPSARRLHYWQSQDGSIELSRVVLHDDFKP